jgi:hypothetical protein
MRTKSLLAAAAIIAAGVASSMAQSNVYSLNIVGYVNKPCPAGLSMVANPLSTTNVLSVVVPTPPDFSQVLKWNPGIQDFDLATYFFGSWDLDLAVAPGDGFFINAASPFTNTFVGEALTGVTTRALGVGLNQVGSKIAKAGNADTLGLTAALVDFDQILLFDNGINDYVGYTYFFGSWDLGAPPINVADGLFVNSSAGGTWTNTFIP